MVTEVRGVDGEGVHVLTSADLDDAKNSLIRWLVLSAIPLALLLGVYAERVQATNERQDVELGRAGARLEQAQVVKERLDSVLIEMRHLSDAVRAMDRTVARVAR